LPRAVPRIRRRGGAIEEGTRLMTWDAVRQNRTLARYRLIFRTSLVMLAIGLLGSAAGLLGVIAGADPVPLFTSVLIADLAALNAYKAVTSTVKILDMDPRNWRELN
jgi:hypothetical protein